MEIKKNKSAEVERYSSVFMQIGLVIALSLVLTAFKWKGTGAKAVLDRSIDIEEEPIDVNLLVVEKKMKKPVPKTQKKKVEPKPKPVVIELVNVDKLPIDTLEFDPFVDDTTDFDPDLVMGKSTTDIPDEVIDYRSLTKIPEFPGGMSALAEFLKKNLVYPEFEQGWGISGKVRVRFVVDKKGNVESVEVVESNRKNFSEEALRVAKLIPRWIPGEQMGKRVKCRFEIPIHFRTR